MHIYFSPGHQHDPGHQQDQPGEPQDSVHPYPHEINTSDGAEFLDDAIRMKEQPYGHAEAEEDE